ncbi:MAG: DUF1801 domain-containing protein [Planctomycetota bacterium]
MPQAPASVDDYLASLPPERRQALEAVRRVILENLDPRVVEVVQYGMIGYAIPHSVYPQGYHCDPKQPLPFASLASQKNHMAAYLFCLYCDEASVEQFVEAWKATGKRLDMGKSCVRFKKLEDVPLEVLGEAIAAMTVDRFIAFYEGQIGRGPGRTARSTKKVAKASGKSTAESPAKSSKATKRTAKKQATAKKATAKRAIAKKGTAKKSTAKKATKKATAKKATKKATAKKVSKRRVVKKTTSRKAAKKTTKRSPARSKR